MAATRSRFRPFRSVCLALLALVAAGCQSEGAGADDADADDDEAAEPAEPNAVIRVPERDTVASESSDSSTSDPPAQNPSGDDEEPEPAATEPESTVAPAATFAACISAGGAYSDCETIFVTVVQSAPERCIQLTIDNCGTYGRQGLPGADTPFEWRLAGGTVSPSASPCELGAFYSGATSLANATGSISWDETARTPTDVTFDLSLELLAAGEGEAIELSTPAPLQPTTCDE
jgi:hypothetical protein